MTDRRRSEKENMNQIKDTLLRFLSLLALLGFAAWLPVSLAALWLAESA